ncbi:MAG: endopeptidase La [Myxococcota bacterium]|jgi:ATP-dependent Lon protease|nr:endopeptidase La [Myxococcota bacterium]
MNDTSSELIELELDDDDGDLPQNVFIFPLREMLVFPDVILPIVVSQGPLLEIVKRAQAHNDFLGFVLNRGEDEIPKAEELARIGCLGHVVRMHRMPDGGYTLFVHARRRMRLLKFLRSDRLIAQVEYLEDEYEDNDELQALWRNVQRALTQIAELSPQIPKEAVDTIVSLDKPGKLADMIGAHFPFKLEDKLQLLESLDVKLRLEKVYELLLREMDLIEIGKKIHESIRAKIEESQREFFLREQLKAIRAELGEERDEKGLNIEEYDARIKTAGMSEEAERRAVEQLDRLRLLTTDAAEYHMIRTYLDWLCDLPWAQVTEDNLDLEHAEKVLDDDHQGLEDIKRRIVEFLAVKRLKPDHQGQIICFVGPPGVGKTSLARSINRALGRKFFGFSLGGLRDEAEIKGHRRTYIGAMPGKILQGLKRVGSRNPVFILDEIDKLGSDWRGDPSSAMLDVLDPTLNNAFTDYYIDVPFNLSDVMFIATANTTSTIPRALLDRMEVIELAGYIDEEKLAIAKHHLVPRQIAAHGLSKKNLRITDGALKQLIRDYTREAGVRNLERTIAKVCRRIATKVARETDSVHKVDKSNLEALLGPAPFTDEVISRGQGPGIAAGLAWTQFGGEVLFIETTRMPGKEQLKLTGQLGEVMAESVQIAFSYVRSRAAALGIDEKAFQKLDYHVHFPAGGVPKDGPSAGIAITSSLLSLLLERALPARLAMTGEITLVGNVLAVGGIKEKVTAARRAGARHVILPARNRKDLVEVPEHVKAGLEFHFAEHYREVFELLFGAGRARLDAPRDKPTA